MSFSDPSHNIEQFDLQSGMKVADFGTGTGFYALAAAKAVGEGGRVYAIDVQKELLEKLKREATHKKIHNVEVIWGNVENLGGSKLRDAAVDAVIVANLLFQIEHKENFINEIKRILKPKGKVLLVDWQDSFGGMGPDFEKVISKSSAQELFERAGLSYERDVRAGEHHYGLIFRKN